jgi:hypothetical protein
MPLHSTDSEKVGMKYVFFSGFRKVAPPEASAAGLQGLRARSIAVL